MLKMMGVLLCVHLPLISGAQSSSSDVPNAAKIRFMEDFISASQVVWARGGEGTYTAAFVYQSHEKQASYDRNGDWLFTETKVFPAQVPQPVMNELSDRFKECRIDEIIKVEAKTGVRFRFRVLVKNELYEVEVDLSGQVKSSRKLSEVTYEEDDDKQHKHHKHDKKKHKHKRGKQAKPEV
jgi:hypothetical protein